VFKLDTGVQRKVLTKRFIMSNGERNFVVGAAKLKCVVKNFEHKKNFQEKKTCLLLKLVKRIDDDLFLGLASRVRNCTYDINTNEEAVFNHKWSKIMLPS
jgi:hypothetical protein